MNLIEKRIIGKELMLLSDEELLVFGYACKVFRDENTYGYIEDEKHLIPWMGDATTLIDRYDGRGHLHDLSEFDADLPSNRNKFVYSEEERRIEELCDQERYVDLYKDVEMEKFYQEEEMKRFYLEQKEYGAVSFSYAESTGEVSGETPSATTPSELETTTNDDLVQFTPPAELLLPEGMRAPDSVKMNAIIEKTAVFVATQGTQMEILIKAKQRNNSQFEFLDCDHYLNPYYQQMLKMIKEGSYKPKSQEKKEEEDDNSEGTDDDDDDEGYLHPSLFASNSALKEAPVINHPPVNILDTAYGQLLRNLNIPILSSHEKPVEPKSDPVTPNNNEETSSSSSSSNAEDSNSSFGLSEINWNTMDPAYIASYTGVYDGSLAPPPPPPPPPGAPPPDALLVIDKLALYVARNGPQFEGSIRAKREPRFAFLESHHAFNAYYEQKKLDMMEEVRREMSEKAGEFNRDGNRNISFSFKDKKNAADNDQIVAPPPPRPALGPNALAALQQAQQIASQINQNFAQMASIKPLSTVTNETFKPEPKKAFGPEPPPPEVAQKMKAQQMAEKKLRDHLQGKKNEEDVKAERKRKVEMFVRMLKKGKIEASSEKTNDEPEGAADRHAGRDNGTVDSHRESSRSKSRSKAPSPHHSSHHRHRHHHHRHHHHRRRSRSPPRAFAVVRRSLSRSPSSRSRRSPHTPSSSRRSGRSRSQSRRSQHSRHRSPSSGSASSKSSHSSAENGEESVSSASSHMPSSERT